MTDEEESLFLHQPLQKLLLIINIIRDHPIEMQLMEQHKMLMSPPFQNTVEDNAYMKRGCTIPELEIFLNVKLGLIWRGSRQRPRAERRDSLF